MCKYLFKSLLSILECILEEMLLNSTLLVISFSSPVGNVPKLGTAHMPINSSRDKQTLVVFACNSAVRMNDHVSATVWTKLTQNVRALGIHLHGASGDRWGWWGCRNVNVLSAPEPYTEKWSKWQILYYACIFCHN